MRFLISLTFFFFFCWRNSAGAGTRPPQQKNVKIKLATVAVDSWVLQLTVLLDMCVATYYCRYKDYCSATTTVCVTSTPTTTRTRPQHKYKTSIFPSKFACFLLNQANSLGEKPILLLGRPGVVDPGGGADHIYIWRRSSVNISPFSSQPQRGRHASMERTPNTETSKQRA